MNTPFNEIPSSAKPHLDSPRCGVQVILKSPDHHSRNRMLYHNHNFHTWFQFGFKKIQIITDTTS
jgi:hypothetical protein